MARSFVLASVIAAVLAPAGAQAQYSSLAKISVLKKLPQFKSEDSYRLDKVLEAMKLATPDMLVHFDAQGRSWLNQNTYEPVPHHVSMSPQQCGKGTEPIMMLGGTISGQHEHDGWKVVTSICLDHENSTAAGLVWEVKENQTVVFVTADGSRFEDLAQWIVPGVEKASSWDPGIRFIDAAQLAELGKAGDEAAAKLSGELDGLAATWSGCAEKAWGPSAKEFAAIDRANILPDAAAARRAAVEHKYEKIIDKKCGASMHKYIDLYVKMMKERSAKQDEILAVAKARLAK